MHDRLALGGGVQEEAAVAAGLDAFVQDDDPVEHAPARELQDAGAIWAINTGRSVDLLEKGLAEFALPIRPDFILTTERDVFRPARDRDGVPRRTALRVDRNVRDPPPPPRGLARGQP